MDAQLEIGHTIIDTSPDSSPTIFTLEQLRDWVGKKRLGSSVLASIVEKLRKNGVTYYPAWVLDRNPEPRQNQEVRLIFKESLVGRLVNAINDPSSAGDALLQQATGKSMTPEGLAILPGLVESGIEQVEDVIKDLDTILGDLRRAAENATMVAA